MPSQPEIHPAAPTFEHAAFPIGFGFVAGFVDLFGFMAWHGLLAAHVTGNLVFLAYGIVRGQYAFVMKLAALPVFAVSVAGSAWLIETLSARGRHPFLPSIILQALTLGACLLAGLLLPVPQGPDDIAVLVAGSIALFAMGLQNAIMRLILNNLPSTTAMTNNITYIAAEMVQLAGRISTASASARDAAIAHRVKQIALTLGGFTLGAFAGGLAQLHVGYPGLLLPIAVLLGLLPVGRAALHAAARL